MKKSILMFSVLVSVLVSVNAQSLSFEKVVNVEGATKEQIYNALNEWVMIAYNSGNDVIQLSDKETGIIILKGAYNLKYSGFQASFDGRVKYTVKIEIRDERFKITVNSFNHKSKNTSAGNLGSITEKKPKNGMNPISQKVWNKATESTQETSEGLFVSVESFIENHNFLGNTNDDW